MGSKWVLGLSVMALAGCATGINTQYYNPGVAKKEAFKQCRGFNCSTLVETKFTGSEWKKVEAVFKKKPAKTLEEERNKIANAIALMERIIGEKTGAKADVARASMSYKTPYQLDCIDETTNTNNYLDFIETAGLLKFHKRGLPVHRGYFINGWPHNTASIRELESNQQYVVDSYYTANGEPPYIMPVDVWLGGWKPPEEKKP